MIRLFSDTEGNYVLEALDLGRVELGRTTKYKMYMKNIDPTSRIPEKNSRINYFLMSYIMERNHG